jgi:hypothetical protein
MVMVLILKNSTLGQLGCAHMVTIILQCTLLIYGVPGVGMGAFFVMIRMAVGTRPNSVQWIQNTTEGKYFCVQVGCVFNVLLL